MKTMIAKPLNVLVLGGGNSSERNVSLTSANHLVNILKATEHRVSFEDLTELRITDSMRAADIVFPALHGGFGEDGRLQALMEQNGICFACASSKACRLAMDKLLSKELMNAIGVNTTAYVTVPNPEMPLPTHLGLPLVVKPANEGSSVGISLVETESQWGPALREAFKYDQCVIAEEYIDGIETTIGVVCGEALPMYEIEYDGKILDQKLKHLPVNEANGYFCPARHIPTEIQSLAAEAALKFARALGNTL